MNTNGGFFKSTALPVIVLALSVFAVYYPALGYGFVYDDSELILGNRWVLSFSNIPEAFSTHTFGFREEGYQAISYRPLLFVIYMAEYAVFGFEPWGWHLVNVTAHAVNAALVFFILRQAVEGEGRGYACDHAGLCRSPHIRAPSNECRVCLMARDHGRAHLHFSVPGRVLYRSEAHGRHGMRGF